MDRGEGREIQFQSPVSLVTLIAMNRLENITYGGGKETTAGGEGGAELCNMARPRPFNRGFRICLQGSCLSFYASNLVDIGCIEDQIYF